MNELTVDILLDKSAPEEIIVQLISEERILQRKEHDLIDQIRTILKGIYRGYLAVLDNCITTRCIKEKVTSEVLQQLEGLGFTVHKIPID